MFKKHQCASGGGRRAAVWQAKREVITILNAKSLYYRDTQQWCNAVLREIEELTYCVFFFLFVSFAQFNDKLGHSLTQVDWCCVIVFLSLSCSAFSLIIALNASADYSHLKTCPSASLRLNPCDWGRESFLWHATKICPGEWVRKGFWEGTVSKNESQHERTRSRRRFSGSPRPGSYSLRQRFKHCFAWLYL